MHQMKISWSYHILGQHMKISQRIPFYSWYSQLSHGYVLDSLKYEAVASMVWSRSSLLKLLLMSLGLPEAVLHGRGFLEEEIFFTSTRPESVHICSQKLARIRFVRVRRMIRPLPVGHKPLATPFGSLSSLEMVGRRFGCGSLALHMTNPSSLGCSS